MWLNVIFSFISFLFLLNVSIFLGVVSSGYEIETLKSSTGKILWIFSPPWRGMHSGIWANYILPYSDKNVYVYMNNWGVSYLYKLTPNGNLVWNVTIYHSSVPMPPAMADDGTIYLISWYLPLSLGTAYPSFIYAYSPNGTLEWKKNLGFDGPFGGLAFGINHTLYFKGKKYLYCMTNLGEIKWKKLFYGGVTTPDFFKDTLYLSWIGNSTQNLSKLYALDMNGKIKWTFSGGTTRISSPIVDPSGGVIYIYFDKLYALNLSGYVKWSSNITGSAPTVGSDRLYITKHITNIYGTSNYLYSLSKENGSILWKVKINELVDTASVEVTSPVIGSDGNIYVGTWYTRNNTGYLYSITPEGKIRWRIKLDGGVITEPAVGDDGTIYVGTTNGTLYAIGGEENNQDNGTSVKDTMWYYYVAVGGGIVATVSAIYYVKRGKRYEKFRMES